MTNDEMAKFLVTLPPDCKVICNTGWEFEADINGIWYSESLNEVHLTQGGTFEKNHGYKNGFKLIYCEDGW